MRAGPAAAGLAGLAVLLAATEGVVAAGWVSALVVPLPTDVAVATVELMTSGQLGDALATTLYEAAAASFAAIVLGIAAGYALVRYTALGRAYESWFAALFAAPIVLLYPLFLVVFGRSATTIIVMGVVTGVAPIILNTVRGLVEVPGRLVDVGRAANCSPAQLFWKVQFPAAAPTVFTGIRLGIIYTLVNVIGIEFLINFGGLGNLVSATYDRFDVPGMYAAILFIVLLSALFFVALGAVETRIRPT
jgi:NitT/TauT family transport system permease protein